MAEHVPISAGPPPAVFGTGSAFEWLRAVASQPAIRKALPWFLGIAALGGVGLSYQALAPTPQRILYSDLDDGERAKVAATLEKAGITYRINNDTGVLTVSEGDLYKARMLVAGDGALAAPDSGSGLDNLPLGASRTMEGERLRVAREHELMLTIQEIDGIEAVRVHLAEAAKSVFVRDETPPSASVMVRLAKGRQLGDSQVGAIVNLVAGSVPGLSPDAVRVADQHGRLLSQRSSVDSDRLELQGRVEEKLRGQLDALLTPMLGPGNFSSEIQVELDLDQVTSAKESYDKSGVMRSESAQLSQNTSPGSGAAGGVPGVLSNTPSPPTTLRAGGPVAAPAPAATPGPASPNAESSATRTYDFGREVLVANAAPGKLRRLSVAVALSQTAMKKFKPADVDQIKQLVAATVGADLQRGDQITVLVRPFDDAAAERLPFYESGWFAMVVRSSVALIAILLMLILGVRPLIRALKRMPTDGDDAVARSRAGAQTPVAPRAMDPAFLGRQVGLAQRIVEEKPEDALVALRQLLGQGDTEARS